MKEESNTWTDQSNKKLVDLMNLMYLLGANKKDILQELEKRKMNENKNNQEK